MIDYTPYGRQLTHLPTATTTHSFPSVGHRQEYPVTLHVVTAGRLCGLDCPFYRREVNWCALYRRNIRAGGSSTIMHKRCTDCVRALKAHEAGRAPVTAASAAHPNDQEVPHD